MTQFLDDAVAATTLPTLPVCFALLDDASSGQAHSRLYTDLQRIVDYQNSGGWNAFLQEAQNALLQGDYVLALLSYETGAQLQAIEVREAKDAQNEANSGLHLQFASRFFIFKKCTFLSQDQVKQLLQQHSEQESSSVFALRANVNQTQFTQAIEKILAYIQAGDTYQVNYTYRLHFQVLGSPIHLYANLRQRQPVPYGALICMPDGEAILSLSPELFVRHQQGQLFAKPMKGTAAATGDAIQDEKIALALSQDEKNRAENVMIVDLLRNDLGKIAKTGTVKVNKLFDVHRYASVLQMTSDIEAQLRDDVTLPDTLSALFPCGSITGAPKRRTMEIIREVETENRGLYTGAIGWFDPPKHSRKIGDFCLSVPIRTLSLSAPNTDTNKALGKNTMLRHGVMGVGAGIVHDSVAQDEFEECQLKAKFLTGMQTSLTLFETMRASKDEGCALLEKHLQRLQTSAALFQIPCDVALMREKVRLACDQFLLSTPYRLRLALSDNGEIELQSTELVPIAERVNIILSKENCQTPALFLAHKTSIRAPYDRAWKEAEAIGAFDAIFVNQEGFVTEGGRSNIFIRQQAQWFTPPLSDGVLPGVMRAILLEDASWNASEKQFTWDEVLNAEEVIICNALRGVMPANVN